MTHSGLAELLDQALGLVKKSPSPDEPISDQTADAVVDAVVDAVTEVHAKPPKREPEPEPEPEAEGEIAPPTYLVPTPVELDEARQAKREDKYAPKDPEAEASWRQKRFLQSLGQVIIDTAKGREKVSIRLMFPDGSEERAEVDRDWNAGLAHDAIETLLKGVAFEHPDGYTIYPNRKYLAKRAAKS
jgi:hypothetical protein